MMKKKFRFLSLLLLCLFSLVGFGYCDYYSDIVQSITLSVNSGYNYDGFMCIGPTNSNCGVYTKIFINSVQVDGFPAGQNHKRLWCGNGNINFVNGHTQGYDCTYNVYTFSGFNLNCPECPECQQCPEINTGDILSGYIAISDVNDSYCISNGLCGEVSTGLSQLFINDIRHESMPFINITIPEEFNRNYNYTGNGTQFDLNVLGYNTDSDYIAGIIETQKSTPNDEDLNNIISGILPLFVPGIVIILFLYFVFRFVKKVF